MVTASHNENGWTGVKMGIQKGLTHAPEEMKELKESSISNISNIAAETTAEVIKQIVNIEVNKSSVTAVVDDVTKRRPR